MDYKKHARLTVRSREQLAKKVVEGRLSWPGGRQRGLTGRRRAKWVRRYRQGGVDGVVDRARVPSGRHRAAPRTRSSASRVAAGALDRLADRPGHRPEPRYGQPHPEPAEPEPGDMLEPQVRILRYEHAAPGDLLHLDIKKLARIVKARHRVTGDPRDESRAPAGSTSTSPSTTTRGSPTRALS